MSDSSKAVFLSYASQDANAVKRICETLRAAGVEVWFDADGGLEHGDEWDAKIRRQVKECVLFIAVISANTQARHEGYFRIEWDLAAERARGIASGVPFILPVVIDDTREPKALVPDRFRAVQWTRLPGGEMSPEVRSRLLKLWSHRMGAAVAKSESWVNQELATSPAPNGNRRSRLPRLVAGGAAVLLLAAAFSWWRNGGPSSPPLPSPRAAAKPAAASLTPARQLVAKARELLDKPEMARAELDAADALCKRAATLDPTDAEVWAASATVHTWYVYHNFDSSRPRREAARDDALRAVQLDPQSFEARLAQVLYWVRGGAGSPIDAAKQAEAEKILRALLVERPDEPRVLFTLGFMHILKGQGAEGVQLLERGAQHPGFTAVLLDEIGYFYRFLGRFADAEAVADRSMAAKPYWNNLGLKLRLALEWHGDVDRALEILNLFPLSARQEDSGIRLAVEVHYWRREPKKIIELLNSQPKEWLRANVYDGPTAFLTARAHLLAGRPEAAKGDFRRALALLDRRLAEEPNEAPWIGLRAQALHHLGEVADAQNAYQLFKQLGAPDLSELQSPVEVMALFDPAEALSYLERTKQAWSLTTAATLRLQPSYDPLRDLPGFRALLARAEADPRLSPKADGAAKTSKTSTSERNSAVADPAMATPAKSVAVLAFANLSDDKENEYFSDGISEELLNVLAKIPELKVSARTSAFSFKGRNVPIPEIAKQLGVAHVVEGSVRKIGPRVRITAQLINGSDGFHVWSDNFDRELKDIFAVQDEIARLIAEKLQLSLGAVPRPVMVVHPEVYALALEGRQHWNQRTEPAFARAEAAFNQALKLDPDFALSHAGLADVWLVRAIWLREANEDSREQFEKADHHARRALSLDSSRAEIHATLGLLHRFKGRPEESQAAFQRALAINPNYATGRHWYGLDLTHSGRIDLGLKHFGFAVELDPLSPIILNEAALCFWYAGRLEEALDLGQRVQDLLAANPALTAMARGAAVRWRALQQLGRGAECVAAARAAIANQAMRSEVVADAAVVLILAGETEAAARGLERLVALPPGQRFFAAPVFAALGRFDEAIAAAATTPAAGLLRWPLLYDPVWDPVRADPRFQQLLGKLRCLEEYKVARETLARLRKESAVAEPGADKQPTRK